MTQIFEIPLWRTLTGRENPCNIFLPWCSNTDIRHLNIPKSLDSDPITFNWRTYTINKGFYNSQMKNLYSSGYESSQDPISVVSNFSSLTNSSFSNSLNCVQVVWNLGWFSQAELRVPDKNISDGEWHHIHLKRWVKIYIYQHER